jgi:hypothetical protein
MVPETASECPATCDRELADIAIPLNRSSHVTSDRQRQAADTLDAAFREVS